MVTLPVPYIGRRVYARPLLAAQVLSISSLVCGWLFLEPASP